MASSSSSGSDRDDAFDADMEALRRACMLTGADPSNVGGAGSDSESESGPESGGTDDAGLLLRLRERFSSPSPALNSLPSNKPSSNLPQESNCEDDFETLRAVQKRFKQFESDSLRKKPGKLLEEPEIAVGIDVCGPETPNRSTELSKELGYSYNESHTLDNEECNSIVRDLMPPKFPKSAQNFVDALKKNRSCQKLIRRKLIEIEAKIEKNKELKERIKCLMNFQVACKRKVMNVLCQRKDPRVKLISVKKPTSENSSKTTLKKLPALHFGPGENSHILRCRMVLERFPVSLCKQPWSKIEKENLAKGIKQQYQEMLILNSMNMESDEEGITDSSIMSATTLSDLEFTPEKIRSFMPLVNWNRLASMYVMGRSGTECEARWLNCEDPMINHSPWTVMEDKKLLFIVQQRGIYNWIDISILLGTHRTPFQCLLRYQRSLNPHILKKEWTEEDDVKLSAAVENYGDNKWQFIASCLEGRTGPQCSNRWKKTLNPERKKVGRWSVDEDKQLKVAVMLFGAKNWNKIAWFAPGRTQVQCRERWLNCLDPALNLNPWTAEEDAKLLDAIAVHGNCWSKIAACIPPRTDNQCRRRWKILLPEEVKLLQAVAQIKKTALISNFVDRESERPAIGPNDFTSIVNSTISEKTDYVEARKKKLSDHQPKKSKAKSRRVIKENSMEDQDINNFTDTVPADLAHLPSTESNSTEHLGICRSGNKRSRSSDKRPRKSRVKSGSHLKENSTKDCMINTSSDIAPAGMSLTTAVNSASTEGVRIGGTTDITLSENQQSTDRHLVPDTSADNSATESISCWSKRAKRKHEQLKSGALETTAGGTVGDSLLVSETDYSAIMTNHSQRARNTKSRGPGANDQRGNSCENVRRKNKMQCKGTPRTMYVGDVDDSSLLMAFNKKEKRKGENMVFEENTQAAEDPFKTIAICCGGGDDDDDDSSLLATFYKKAKRKQKCIVTKENTQAAK
ncbi:uncharacterized protein LOC135582744 isoform X1 [Musa acuminata AAA Group]|uniref:uncharacterized protein LOC135582744 isoform X1 n=1 Tax=Musa acuminata AAA Group TaxID=214697 RepID=UPI0031D2FC0D